MSPFIKKIGATWLVTCIAGSVLLTIGFTFYTSSFNDASMILVAIFGVSLAISLVASIPAFLLYGWATKALMRSDDFARMAGRCLLAAALPYATFGILFLFLGVAQSHDLVTAGLLMPIPYAIVFLACVFLFPPTETNTDEYREEAADVVPVALPTQFHVAILVLGVAGLYYQAAGFIETYNVRGYTHGIGMLMVALSALFLLAHITALLLMGFKKKAGWSLFLLLTANHVVSFTYFFIITNGAFRIIQQNPRFAAGLPISITMLVIILLPSMRKAYGVTRKTTITTIAAAVGLFILINLLQFFGNHFQ